MNSYQEKLKEYTETRKETKKKISKEKKKLESIENNLKEQKESFLNYLKESLFKNYEIGREDLEDGRRIYYPIFDIPDGFEIIKQQSMLDVDKFGHEYAIIHECIIESKEKDFKISIIAISELNRLGYFNKNIQFEIKQSLVMDYLVNYEVTINDMKFHLDMNFKGQLIENILQDVLKGKYICYSDFNKDGIDMSYKRYKRINIYKRLCKNELLYSKKDWKEIIERNLKEDFDGYRSEEIVSYIEETLKQFNTCQIKVYSMKEKKSIVLIISNADCEHYCIAYEDEKIILEIPVPIKYLKIEVLFVDKELSQGDVGGGDFYCKLSNCKIEKHLSILVEQNQDEIDMNKKMYILDILRQFKEKE